MIDVRNRWDGRDEKSISILNFPGKGGVTASGAWHKLFCRDCETRFNRLGELEFKLALLEDFSSLRYKRGEFEATKLKKDTVFGFVVQQAFRLFMVRRVPLTEPNVRFLNALRSFLLQPGDATAAALWVRLSRTDKPPPILGEFFGSPWGTLFTVEAGPISMEIYHHTSAQKLQADHDRRCPCQLQAHYDRHCRSVRSDDSVDWSSSLLSYPEISQVQPGKTEQIAKGAQSARQSLVSPESTTVTRELPLIRFPQEIKGWGWNYGSDSPWIVVEARNDSKVISGSVGTFLGHPAHFTAIIRPGHGKRKPMLSVIIDQVPARFQARPDARAIPRMALGVEIKAVLNPGAVLYAGADFVAEPMQGTTWKCLKTHGREVHQALVDFFDRDSALLLDATPAELCAIWKPLQNQLALKNQGEKCCRSVNTDDRI